MTPDNPDVGSISRNTADAMYDIIRELQAQLAAAQQREAGLRELLGESHRYVVAYAVESVDNAEEAIDEDDINDPPRDFAFIKDAKLLAKNIAAALASNPTTPTPVIPKEKP